MAKLPKRDAPYPGDDVPSIVARIESLADVNERRGAELRLREDALVYRLRARGQRRNERIADGAAKFLSGSILTTVVALVLGGHAARVAYPAALIALLIFVVCTILAAAAEFLAAAWDNEADRIAAALEQIGKGR